MILKKKKFLVHAQILVDSNPSLLNFSQTHYPNKFGKNIVTNSEILKLLWLSLGEF